MCAALVHRGPDGEGVLDLGAAVLGHRRLAVIDPTPTGAQPMRTEDGRHTLVYNGELYNDAEVRAELAGSGVVFRGPSDAETVLRALARWGAEGLARLRGMYALALVDAHERTLLLARDPLGIKPLYFHRLGEELVFASEPGAILTHPAARAEPDLAGISAYLTTIRTVLGSRTMFRGVSAVRPGEALLFDLTQPGLPSQSPEIAWPAPGASADPDGIRDAVRESVRRHLRADVPVCCLLSGGLDSAILATLAAACGSTLDTYCSGARAAEASPASDDFAFASVVAARLHTRHVEAPVTREMFRQRWPEMVRAMGVPMSTPNEVAINEVARRLRADGKVVALSGEGADELFGGYDVPLAAAAEFERTRGVMPWPRGRGEFQLRSNAWVSREEKAGLFQEHAWRGLERDAALVEWCEGEFARAAERVPKDAPLQAHLRYQRRVNLTGLLQRLDTATMLASVEGRTPLADACVCALAESLPMSLKFEAGRGVEGTKIALRRAFGAELPPEVVARAKASFPLPFREWLSDQIGALGRSRLVSDLFSPAAVELVRTRPQEHWRVAWPLINVALWARRWWG